MKKNIVSAISFCGLVMLFIANNSVRLQICSKSNYSCRTNWDTLEQSMYFFVPTFLFSLITYFAPERVFISWWKFARIGIPVVFAGSLIVNLGLLHGRNDVLPALTDIPALILIYGTFILGSVWQIWKGWKKNV